MLLESLVCSPQNIRSDESSEVIMRLCVSMLPMPMGSIAWANYRQPKESELILCWKASVLFLSLTKQIK